MKEKKLHGAFIVLAVTVLCFFSVPTAMAKVKTIDLTVWHQETPPNRVNAFQKVIDKFNAEHPGIRVKQETFSWGVIHSKLFSAIAAGNPPDINFSIPDVVMALKLRRSIVPVDGIVKKIDEEYSYIPSQLVPYYYDGHYWAVPLWTMTHLLYYNKGVFKEAGIANAPQTWDELLEVAEAVSNLGPNRYGFALPASKYMFTDQNLYDFMITNGAVLFDKDGNVVFDKEKTIETLSFYKKLWQYSPPDSISWGWGDSEMTFVSGITSMIMLFPSLTQYKKAEQEGKGPFGATRVPKPKEGGQWGSITYPNGAMVFTQDKEKYEAVREFLLFLMKPEINGAWVADFEAGCFNPTTIAAMKSDRFWRHPVIGYYEDVVRLQLDANKDGKLFGFVYEPQPGIGEIAGQRLLAQVVEKVVTGKMTPKKAAKWGANVMRRMVQEAKE
jgi:multiple sugar transport system substrate-binding protein